MPQNLNYCQHCGSRNIRRKPVADDSPARMFIGASAAIGVTGLIGFFFILRELLRSGITPGFLFLILAAYLVAIFAMFAVLISNARRYGHAATGSQALSPGAESQNLFGRVDTAQLREMSEAPASVTDHTTRTLDNVPVKHR